MNMTVLYQLSELKHFALTQCFVFDIGNYFQSKCAKCDLETLPTASFIFGSRLYI